MDLPQGLKIAQEFFNTRPWKRKQMAAVFINGKQMVGSFNSEKTHPISAKYRTPWSRSHAELKVLKQLRGDLSSGVLYIYRHRASGEFGQARPCPGCMAYIRDRGVRKVVYTTPDGYAVEKVLTLIK
jgi:tRNA(Arg) A34 adenosine deaminase TadA